jgi:hypothetical protein
LDDSGIGEEAEAVAGGSIAVAAISATPRELTFANDNFDMSPIMPQDQAGAL